MDLDIFEPYLAQLAQPLRKGVEEVLERVHPSFWTAPASTSGKYHPRTSLGKGGLVRHTLRALSFFTRIRPTATFAITKQSYQLGIAALILHDTCKHLYSVHCAKAASAAFDILIRHIGEEDAVVIKNCIARHMGPFSDGSGKEPFLSDESTRLEWAVYMADLYSAQRWLEEENV